MNKRELIRKSNEIGIHFFDMFPVEKGVAIGSIFHVGDATWVIGRIDNVVIKGNIMLVEGYCIREEEYHGEGD